MVQFFKMIEALKNNTNIKWFNVVLLKDLYHDTNCFHIDESLVDYNFIYISIHNKDFLNYFLSFIDCIQSYYYDLGIKKIYLNDSTIIFNGGKEVNSSVGCKFISDYITGRLEEEKALFIKIEFIDTYHAIEFCDISIYLKN